MPSFAGAWLNTAWFLDLTLALNSSDTTFPWIRMEDLSKVSNLFIYIFGQIVAFQKCYISLDALPYHDANK